MSTSSMLVNFATKPATAAGLTYALYTYLDESTTLKQYRALSAAIATAISNNFI